ncbi:hypothetical protein [Nodosilinea sp. E11]|uniref:hypothetical protein n=1 Tax=Nodosilinea sp. E11 TaxID=3037479 RepID=UPI002934A128|nr:hypothetical protein [Nodosilinea sp. E11]WOD39729.1 hypothetical protein RRF56_02830 [Nodosilinea sp. E11]
MTLLEDLQSLDLSAIVNARADITVSINSPQLQQVLQGGAGETALGSLSEAIETLRTAADNPTALLQPLMAAIATLLEPLNIDGVPIGQYVEAVRDGTTLILSLFEGIDRDPAILGRSLGLSLSGTLSLLKAGSQGYVQAGGDALGQFRYLIDTVERGMPTDPTALAELAIEILLPFPKAGLVQVRQNLDGIFAAAQSIALPTGRTAGVVDALNAIALAAEAGDRRQVEAGLALLARVRENTLTVLRRDLQSVYQQINRIDLNLVLRPLDQISGTLRSAEQGILEFMDQWREQLVLARNFLNTLTPEQLSSGLGQWVQYLEALIQSHVVGPLEEQVHQLEAWVRSLLRELPLRSLRAEVSRFIHSAAQAIQDLDLDRYAREAKGLLQQIRTTIETVDLGAEMRGGLEEVESTIRSALGGVTTALQTIGDAVNSLAADAQAILQRVADALTQFKAVIDQVTAAINGLDIEAATDQIITSIVELRESAEELLSGAALPEPLRAVVQQLIEFLEGIDFEVVFQPVRDAVGQFNLPDEVRNGISEGLQAARDAIANLIPANLIESIEAEIQAAFEQIRSFDPSSLLAGVTGYLDEAVSFLEDLDPTPVIADIRQPFQAVLDAIDAVEPGMLLQPVVQAYDDLLGNLSLPSPETVVQSTSDAIGNVGETLSRTVVSPIQQLAPEGSVSLDAPPVNPAATPPAPDLPEDLRAGDVVRMFGYLPNKLREALTALTAGPAGEVLRQIDGLSGGLARDLRQLQARLWDLEASLQRGLDDLLIPVGPAQLRAQLAVQANLAGGSFNVEGALGAIAQVGPGALRSALAAEVQQTKGQVGSLAAIAGGSLGASIETAATALERCRLTSLGGSLDSLLAALDPEPIALEMDDLVASALRRASQVLPTLNAELPRLVQRIQSLIETINPGAQAQRFLAVVSVLRDELDVLNPRRLVAELGEVHAALRATLAAYDPAIFAQELKAVLDSVIASVRSLNPAALLGDLSFLDDILDQLEAALPTQALAGVGASLTAIGDRLNALNPTALLDAVEALGPRLVESFEEAVEAIRRELINLLAALRYASGSASASVTVEV